MPGELKPPANGTTPWTCSIDLVDGENQISVIAQGNAFGANSHTFFSAPARFVRTVESQRRWLLDLGTVTRMMTAPNWNDVVNPLAGESVPGALDSTGAKTSLNLSFIRPFLANGFGVKQDGPFPMNAQADSMYVQDAQVAQLRFSGLTSTSSYSLTLFASRETPGNRITKYTVNGISHLYDPTDNVSVVDIFKPLLPDPTGVIDLTVETDNDKKGFAYLGVVQVDEQPFGKLLFDFNDNTLSTRPFWNNVNSTSGVVVTNAVSSAGVVTPVTLTIELGFQAAWDTKLNSSTIYPASAQRDAFYVRNTGTASLRVSGLRPGARYNLRFFSSAPPMSDIRRGDRKTRYTVDTESKTLDALQNTSQTVQFSPTASQTGELIIKVASDTGSGTGSLGVLELSAAP